MSRGANLSIMGLYNNDNTVLDLMVFPDGMTEEEQQTVKDNILVECAEFEFLYPAPVVAKSIIGIWSKKELPYWQRIYNASQLEYNPIENYRRNETETIEDDRTEEHSGSDVNRTSGTDTLARTGTDSVAKTGTDTVTKTGSDSVSLDATVGEEAGGDDRVDNNITGYDNNALVPQSEQETYYGKTIDTTTDSDQVTTYGSTDTETLNTLDTETLNTLDTSTYGKSDTLQHGEKIEHDGTTERTVLAYGNIGVTTTQEMLTQELEVAKIIEVMPVIIQSFKDRFCLMVY